MLDTCQGMAVPLSDAEVETKLRELSEAMANLDPDRLDALDSDLRERWNL